jgi:hypothetical protein
LRPQPARAMWTVLLPLVICGLLSGCAATGGIPEGSSLLGVYKGILRGNVFDGPIEVELFQTPEGHTVFRGRFIDTVAGGPYYFRGTVSGSAMAGKISLGFGSISGEISEDRAWMSGTFRLAQNHGTWHASLRRD